MPKLQKIPTTKMILAVHALNPDAAKEKDSVHRHHHYHSLRVSPPHDSRALSRSCPQCGSMPFDSFCSSRLDVSYLKIEEAMTSAFSSKTTE